MNRLLVIGQIDHANLCNRVARALNAYHRSTVARVWTLQPHPFGYPEEVASPDPPPDLVEFAREVNWLFTSGDGDYFYFDRMRERLPLSPLVHLGTMHAGSAYRLTPDLYNEADARRGFEVRYIGLDSLRFADGDPTVRPLISPAPRTIGERAVVHDRLRVAHAPSSRVTKGTALVLPVLERLAAEGVLAFDLIEGVPFEEVGRRLALCDVLVDQFEPSIGGLGALAVEAMALGLAVVSNCGQIRGEDWARLPFGERPIWQAETALALESILRSLAADRTALEAHQRLALRWARENASPAGTAALWRLPPGLRAAPPPVAPPPRISAPMIVKNEERGIRQALESLVGVADEIVVVDTGSTDKTVEIVEEVRRERGTSVDGRLVGEDWLCGAVVKRGQEQCCSLAWNHDGPHRVGDVEWSAPALRLLHHPWQDDFSEARNFAQDACTGDWCVILDGDEVLEPGDLRESIHAAPDHAIAALGIRLENVIVQYRAHRRDRFRWEKPIHNQLTPTKPGKFAPSTATIRQSYEKGTAIRSERSKPMLLKYFADHPDDPHAPNYLCKFARIDGDWTRAKEWALKTIERMGPNSSYAGAWCILVMAIYMVDGLWAAMAMVDQALEEHPGYADLWQLKANLCALRWKQTMKSVAYQAIAEMVMPSDRMERGWSALAFQLEDDGDDRSVTDNE